MGIQSIRIQNFKSIRDTGELQLKPVNILIGSNGAGKSNFISFFEFLDKLFSQRLQVYIAQNGRADNFLYFGRKSSDFLGGELVFDFRESKYRFKMIPNKDGDLIFDNEEAINFLNLENNERQIITKKGAYESSFNRHNIKSIRYLPVIILLSSFNVYHFQDTSFNSRLKQASEIINRESLNSNGSNIASLLYLMEQKYNKLYKFFEKIVQSVAPFIDRFHLEPDALNEDQIFLRWYPRNYDEAFGAHNLSDGTLRFICLAALLLQPKPPATIIIDEPELGLHPFAISKLAGMIKSASAHSQIIVSTQSASLVNYFEPEDIIVVDRENEQSVFKRQSSEELKHWLEDYSMGELWEKNLLGGNP